MIWCPASSSTTELHIVSRINPDGNPVSQSDPGKIVGIVAIGPEVEARSPRVRLPPLSNQCHDATTFVYQPRTDVKKASASTCPDSLWPPIHLSDFFSLGKPNMRTPILLLLLNESHYRGVKSEDC